MFFIDYGNSAWYNHCGTKGCDQMIEWYTNNETGVVKSNKQIAFEYESSLSSTQATFVKLATEGMESISEAIGNQRLIVLFYVLLNMSAKGNTISKTLAAIATETKVPLVTVKDSFKAFQECDIIRHLSKSSWMVNPTKFSKTSESKILLLSEKYSSLSRARKRQPAAEELQQEAASEEVESEELRKVTE